MVADGGAWMTAFRALCRDAWHDGYKRPKTLRVTVAAQRTLTDEVFGSGMSICVCFGAEHHVDVSNVLVRRVVNPITADDIPLITDDTTAAPFFEVAEWYPPIPYDPALGPAWARQ